MNILIDELPTGVFVHDVFYSVRWQFPHIAKIAILFEENPAPTDGEFLKMGNEQLGIFYENQPEDKTEAYLKLVEFYAHNHNPKELRPAQKEENSKPSYSLKYDAPY